LIARASSVAISLRKLGRSYAAWADFFLRLLMTERPFDPDDARRNDFVSGGSAHVPTPGSVHAPIPGPRMRGPNGMPATAPGRRVHAPVRNEFHWDPDGYLALVRAELPDYDRLQDEVAEATRGVAARAILELGTGSGETARRVLAVHPDARLHGIDDSAEMLAAARSLLAGRDVQLDVGRIERPLPSGEFDLVVSALAVHHLDAAAKAELFPRVAAVLRPGGRFVLADVVTPDDPADAVTTIDEGYDMPSGVGEQLEWLERAGFDARLHWQRRDLAVLVGERR
jgi:tRNA (cmo5U34)-methyltransferase